MIFVPASGNFHRQTNVPASSRGGAGRVPARAAACARAPFRVLPGGGHCGGLRPQTVTPNRES